MKRTFHAFAIAADLSVTLKNLCASRRRDCGSATPHTMLAGVNKRPNAKHDFVAVPRPSTFRVFSHAPTGFSVALMAPRLPTENHNGGTNFLCGHCVNERQIEKRSSVNGD
jgi:hypothetical protein